MKTPLQRLATDLIARGFQVYSDKENKRNYFSFSDGIRFAYIQDSGFRGISISKIYKPSRQFGTGTQVFDELYIRNAELLEKALKTLDFNIIDAVPYYKSADEFVAYQRTRQKKYSAISKEEVTAFIE